MNRLEIANNISTNIERERIKLGMSQAQFAKALDMCCCYDAYQKFRAVSRPEFF